MFNFSFMVFVLLIPIFFSKVQKVEYRENEWKYYVHYLVSYLPTFYSVHAFEFTFVEPLFA